MLEIGTEVDPFRRMPNGIRTVTEALSMVSTDPADYPPIGGDLLGVSAIMLGRLVSKSSLSASDRNDVYDFMSLTRPDVLTHYSNLRHQVGRGGDGRCDRRIRHAAFGREARAGRHRYGVG